MFLLSVSIFYYRYYSNYLKFKELIFILIYKK